jgi:putative tryptophan/tyrosine transport system substrate-binding protein
MRRRELLSLGTAGALALATVPFAVRAQQRMRRIGLLFGTSRELPEVAALHQAWVEGMRDLGWIEGQNFIIEYREARGAFERLDRLARELVDLKVDVIFAPTATSVGPARRATSTIPIVFASHAGPLASGDVATLARPGGNATGLSNQGTDINAKGLDLLKQALPNITRVARLRRDPFETVAAQATFEASKTIAAALKVALVDVTIREISELGDAFERIRQADVQAVSLSNDLIFWADLPKAPQLALLQRLPLIAGSREFAHAGAMMSYSTNVADLYRRSARYIDRILRGANPGDLPVEQAERFDFVVNLKTAKALGITIPEHIMVFATEVIE